MKRAAIFLALLLSLRADSLDALKWLEGEWTAEGGQFDFRRELNGKILVRHNKQATHEDLMVIQNNHADYWDNEGHVIRYKLTAGDKSAVFVSENESGMRYRLTYKSTAPGKVSITFEMAPPGKDFQTYLKGDAQKK